MKTYVIVAEFALGDESVSPRPLDYEPVGLATSVEGAKLTMKQYMREVEAADHDRPSCFALWPFRDLGFEKPRYYDAGTIKESVGTGWLRLTGRRNQI